MTDVERAVVEVGHSRLVRAAEGSLVRAGKSPAVWRVAEREDNVPRDTCTLVLVPVDAHEVPFDAVVDDLPLPLTRLA